MGYFADAYSRIAFMSAKIEELHKNSRSHFSVDFSRTLLSRLHDIGFDPVDPLIIKE